MADKKVSDLAALTGAAVVNNDVLYIVDVSEALPADRSKKITIAEFQLAPYSAGTVNGLLYLNATRTVTTGSDLTWDGSILTTTGSIVSDNTTDSTSTLTGAIQTDGGVGIAKALYVGTTANIASDLTVGGNFVLTGSLDVVNIEVTNIKAKDGTAAMSIADVTGKVTVSSELAVDNLNLSGNIISSTDTDGNINLNPNGTGQVVIGTSLDVTTIEVTNISAKDGTAALTIANSTGVVSFTTAPVLSSLTASTALALDANKNIVSVTNTGTGNNVLATSPTLTTPTLGAATATSINKVTITAPATAATLTLSDGSSLITSGGHSLTLTTTGATNVTLPTSGTLATTGGTVASISFGTTGLTPNTATTGAVTVAGTLAAANGGTGVDNGTRTLTISNNAGTLNFTAASKTLGISNSLTLAGTDATTMTFPATSTTVAGLSIAQTFSAAQTFSDAVTFSATTQNISLGASQTSGTFVLGGTAATGAITLDGSTKTHTLDIGSGATENAATKTINIGTGGVSGSTTTITIGSANGTTTTLNGTVNAGTVNATTLDLTNLEVTNIKAKDGTAALTLADSTGVATFSANPILNAGTANGVVYLNASKVATSGSALQFDGSYFTAASGTGTFLADVVQVSGNATKVNANGVGLEFRGGATPNITAYSRVGSAYLPMILDTSSSIFNISGSEQMRLTSTGLGIGTSSPAHKLDVVGAFQVSRPFNSGITVGRFYNSASTSGAQIYDVVHAMSDDAPAIRISEYSTSTSSIVGELTLSGGDGNVQVIGSTGPLVFGTGRAVGAAGYITSGEGMRLTSTGLGIGTSSPAGRLQIRTSAGGVGLVLDTNTSDSNSNSPVIDFRGEASAGQGCRIAGVNTDTFGRKALVFYTSDTQSDTFTPAERMRITSAGNVGIGTTSPLASLHITKNASGAVGPEIRLNNDSGNFLDAGLISFYGGTFPRASIQMQVSSASAGGRIVFSTGFNPILERMTLDSSGNLGLGVTPSAWFSTFTGIDQTAAALYSQGTTNTFLTTNAYLNTSVTWIYKNSAAALRYDQSSSGHSWFTAPSGTAGNAISFTQAMTLDASGNLVVGTTGSAQGRVHAHATTNAQFVATDATLGAAYGGVFRGYGVGGQGGNAEIGVLDNGTYTKAVKILDNATGILFFTGAGNPERMRLDSSGNLGLGVTPSAWATFKAIDIATRGISLIGNTDSATVSLNSYFNSGWKFAGTSSLKSARYDMYDGGHYWFTGTSGTAGNAITFTQAMTLTAGGFLGIGDTSPNAPLVIKLNGTGAYTEAIWKNDNSTAALAVGVGGSAVGVAAIQNNAYLYNTGNSAMVFGTNNTERARITGNGNLCVGATSELIDSGRRFSSVGGSVAGSFKVLTTSDIAVEMWNSATSGDNIFSEFKTEASPTFRGSITYNRAGGLVAYNTTSDYRAKDILGPVANPGATIDALKVYNGKMKGATVERPMLVAHEAQAVAPYSVTGEKDAVNDDGTPKYQQMDVSSLVPLLIAEIQSLRARVAQLEQGN
jgi:hypothetical protein